jgi:hypothetical protein
MCQAESLTTLYEISFEVDRSGHRESIICALKLSGDTIFCGSEAGIFARLERGKPWRKLVDCRSIDSITSWWDVCYKKKEWKQLIAPARMWRVTETGEVAVFDQLCGCLTKLRIRNSGGSFVELWKDGHGDDYLVRSMSMQGDFISCGTYSDRNTLVAVGRVDKPDYRRILDCPESLKRRIDSVCNQSFPRVFPALNPADSTLWVAVWAYDYMYIADLDGNLLDSVHVSAADYRLPAPPKSRLQTKAVWRDWMSSGWTPINGLWYIPPGYFLLQYRNGWELGLDSIPLYSTAVWNSDRKPVELAVDKHWQIAGVQHNGEIILGRFMYVDGQRSIGLRVVRIEP